MSRHYIIPSFVGAAEDHVLWTGHSPDDRKRSSVCLNGHFKANGAANIQRYSDDSLTPKKVPTTDKETELEYKLFPQQKTLDKIDVWEKEVEAKYLIDGDYEAYCSAKNALSLKRQRAWKSLCKAKGWALEEEDVPACEEPQTSFKEERESFRLSPLGHKVVMWAWWIGLIGFVLWANW